MAKNTVIIDCWRFICETNRGLSGPSKLRESAKVSRQTINTYSGGKKQLRIVRADFETANSIAKAMRIELARILWEDPRGAELALLPKIDFDSFVQAYSRVGRLWDVELYGCGDSALAFSGQLFGREEFLSDDGRFHLIFESFARPEIVMCKLRGNCEGALVGNLGDGMFSLSGYAFVNNSISEPAVVHAFGRLRQQHFDREILSACGSLETP